MNANRYKLRIAAKLNAPLILGHVIASNYRFYVSMGAHGGIPGENYLDPGTANFTALMVSGNVSRTKVNLSQDNLNSSTKLVRYLAEN